ncbi:DUF6582 domain-containing protein [Methylobacterium sp. J-090]|uniref:DUF6582 domain-containing protein n=1 Tax=Methylobacterium sp. J-090 TaxID=2836666 RepID=UPI001FBAE5AF|nr:DUF6582 domain-containing protein [Methylobacterium sp. J-090]MCJ2083725.1 hypothetical protein [Methylobacterium sp. J-090]
MSKLTAKEREALPNRDFALPDEKRFPIEDAAHARNAKARAAQAEKAGNLSTSDKAKVDARADRVLDKN